MQPQSEENKIETAPVTNENVQSNEIKTQQKQEESSPPIKSEENQANWKAFRQQREAERKAKEEAERKASEERARAEAYQKALEAITNKPVPQAHNPYSFDHPEENEDERLQKKISEGIQREIERLENQRRQKEVEEAPARIKRDFPDWDKVCNAENYDYVDYHHPEISQAYHYMPDGYEKRASIYKAIKKLVPNPDSRKDQIKADKNLSKPASISSPGNTQGGNAMSTFQLSEQKKASNWERMQRSLKGLSQ